MFKIVQQKGALILYNKRVGIAILVTIIIGIVLHSIRLDKVPVIGELILGFEKSFVVNAYIYDSPITADMLRSEPKDWPADEGYWFDFINAYSLRLLRQHMVKNQLAIVPNRYILKNTMRLEELIEVLDFVKIHEHKGETGDGSGDRDTGDGSLC